MQGAGVQEQFHLSDELMDIFSKYLNLVQF